MLGLIFFGTRGVTYGSDGGQFFCPTCEAKEAYRHRKVRRFFTLYFIPMIPLDLLGEYVECQRCTGTYKLSVLEKSADATDQREEAAFRGAMRRILVLMMLADGIVEQSEIDAIQSILSKLEKRDVPREEIDKEVERAQEDMTDIEEFCRGMAGYLNDSGREMVVKAAILVASADGNFDQSERDALSSIASALNMSRAHFTGVVNDMTREMPPAGQAVPPN